MITISTPPVVGNGYFNHLLPGRIHPQVQTPSVTATQLFGSPLPDGFAAPVATSTGPFQVAPSNRGLVAIAGLGLAVMAFFVLKK